jgi:integrase
MIHEVRTVRGGERKVVTVTQMHRTWHSLRHRFARDMIDGYDMGVGALTAIGGWKDFGVVRARYYQTGREHLDDAWATLSRGPVHI